MPQKRAENNREETKTIKHCPCYNHSKIVKALAVSADSILQENHHQRINGYSQTILIPFQAKIFIHINRKQRKDMRIGHQHKEINSEKADELFILENVS